MNAHLRPGLLAASSLCCAMLGATPRLQDPPPIAPTAAQTERAASSLEALGAIHEALATRIAQLRDAQAEVERAPQDDPRRAELSDAVRAAQAEVDRLRRDFETVATGVDANALAGGGRAEFDLRAELERLVQPLILELNDVTETPRQIEQLRSEVALHEQRVRLADQALGSLARILAAATDDSLTASLRALEEYWRSRRAEFAGQARVAQLQLEARLAERSSLLDSARNLASGFFRKRGLNLVLAIGTFLAVLLGLRVMFRPVRRLGARRERERGEFYLRIVNVLLHAFAATAATFAALMVLWVAGDWVLLGLALVFLIGLLWASKATVPLFFEQIRLMLNLGSVREREVVVIDGLPWRVDSLNLYTRLVNPLLSGGSLRLPIRDMIGRYSRPCTDKDVWFPCRDGDWVLLSDGVRGKVVSQTPQSVQLVQLGGARVTYPTAEFLTLSPKNLSANFRVAVSFGIDYSHQAICTTAVPAAMESKLTGELGALVGADNLVNVRVEFERAGASSLDYAVLADFSGEVARQSDQLQRAIQRILVDACNEHGWVIPFQQVTLHQAKA